MRDRRNFNPVFAVAAASYATGAAASIGFSPTSTLSSVSSSEVSDFVADFRQAYNNLRHVREPGKLTKDELGDILFLLDQDPSEDAVNDMFVDVDVEGKGVVDFEAFLCIVGSRIRDPPHASAHPVINNSPPGSASRSTRKASCSNPHERAVAAAQAAGGGPQHPPTASGGPVAGAGPPGWLTRPESSASGNSWHQDSGTGKGSSAGSSSRKGKAQILWWGFQDLADTL